MKKLLLLLSTTLLSISALAAQFEEGTHYTVIESATKPSKPVVTEFFSFYCPHCYGFEPVIAGLKDTLPETSRFEKVHVSFMDGDAVSMSKAYATMVALKAEDKVLMPMFTQIHEYKKGPNNIDQLRQIFVDNGVDGKKFDSAFNGFAVDSMQRKFDKQFAATGIRGVPAVVVNNKYIVNGSSVKDIPEYYKLVNYLLTL